MGKITKLLCSACVNPQQINQDNIATPPQSLVAGITKDRRNAVLKDLQSKCNDLQESCMEMELNLDRLKEEVAKKSLEERDVVGWNVKPRFQITGSTSYDQPQRIEKNDNSEGIMNNYQFESIQEENFQCDPTQNAIPKGRTAESRNYFDSYSPSLAQMVKANRANETPAIANGDSNTDLLEDTYNNKDVVLLNALHIIQKDIDDLDNRGLADVKEFSYHNYNSSRELEFSLSTKM